MGAGTGLSGVGRPTGAIAAGAGTGFVPTGFVPPGTVGGTKPAGAPEVGVGIGAGTTRQSGAPRVLRQRVRAAISSKAA